MKKIKSEDRKSPTPSEMKGIGTFFSKVQNFFQTKEPSSNEKMSRRQFLRKGLKGAAAVGLTMGLSSIPTNAIASLMPEERKKYIDKYKDLRKDFPTKGNTEGIQILGESENDIKNVSNVIKYLKAIPKEFNDKLGIKYDEPKRLVEEYSKTDAPILAYSKLSEQNNGAIALFTSGTNGDAPLVVIDSTKALNRNIEYAALNVFHEMTHFAQNKNNVHLLKKVGYSATNVKENEIDCERNTKAKECELFAISSMLIEHYESGEKSPPNDTALKDIARKKKDLFISQANECNNPIASYNYAATVAVLAAIEKGGAEAITNQETKKAAYETLSGNNKHAIAFKNSYNSQAEKHVALYEKKIDPNVRSNPDKSIDEIKQHRFNLDSRSQAPKPVLLKASEVTKTAENVTNIAPSILDIKMSGRG
ncbi:MAG: hypothetical protein GY804_03410 [Alphaproteobacteria bacterium]|nr:hypothetical protein [Alphaproteobacteria bacterium]